MDMETEGPDRVGEPIRVLVADDHETVRRVVAHVLQEDERLVIVGEAADGIEAIERLSERPADIVLMDIRMPRLDGIGATRAIRCIWPGTRIVGLTVYRSDEISAQAIAEAGADEVLSKSEGCDTIVASILRLMGQSRTTA